MFLLSFVILLVCVFVFCFFKTGTAPEVVFFIQERVHIDIYTENLCHKFGRQY